MKVKNPKLITRFGRAAIEAFVRGAARAGGHCCLMKSTFEEAGGPREAAALAVPVYGPHNLFLAGPLAPDAGERFGGDAGEGYGIPLSFIDAALRKNPEGRSVEIYLGGREADVVGIGFDGGPQEWECVEAGMFLTAGGQRGTGIQEEYDDRYLAKHVVTEYTPAAVRLLLAVVDGTEYRDDILIRGRPAWFPEQGRETAPSLVTGVPAGMQGEIGLTGPYRGSIPGSWPHNHIEVLRVPRQIVEILAGSSSGTPEQNCVLGERARMVLGSSEGAYCRVEFGEERLQRCLTSLPRFPRSLRLPERDRIGDERIRLLRAGGRDLSMTDGGRYHARR